MNIKIIGHFAGFSRQFGSGLRAGFADFLRKIDGLRCFFPAHVREKTPMRKSLCDAQTFLASGSLLWTEEAFYFPEKIDYKSD